MLPLPLPGASLAAAAFIKQQEVTGAIDNVSRHASQPGDMNAPTLVCCTTGDLMQEDQPPLMLLDEHLHIGHACQSLERCKLEVVRCKQRAAADLAVQVFDHGLSEC